LITGKADVRASSFCLLVLKIPYRKPILHQSQCGKGVVTKMCMDEELKKRVDVIVGLGRLAGGMLILIGGPLVFIFAQAALDPNALIEFNGIPTNNKSTKILAVFLTCLFPIIGLLLAFSPSKLMDKMAVKIITLLS